MNMANKTTVKTCPKCSARYNDEVITCDCGYEFYSSSEVSKMLKGNRRGSARTRAIVGLFLLVTAAVITLLSYAFASLTGFPIVFVVSGLVVLSIREIVAGLWGYLKNL
jgi:hypothetical protein